MKLSGIVHYMMPYCISYFKFSSAWFWGFPDQNKDLQNMGEQGYHFVSIAHSISSFILSSPKPKVEVSFSDQNLSVIRRRCCCCFIFIYIFMFFSKSTWPHSTKLCKKSLNFDNFLFRPEVTDIHIYNSIWLLKLKTIHKCSLPL